ncbi:MAG: hypothetical protein Q4G35_09340 [Propionibacteriaceae bacterium]|nr:hypothetical protein [Propionibacteriaceae bacterium]
MTDPLNLQPIPFSTPVGQLQSPAVVELTDGWGVVVEPVRSHPGQLDLRLSHLRGRKSTYLKRVDPRTEVGDLVVRQLPQRAERLFSLPTGEVQDRHNPGWGLLRATPFVVLPPLMILLGMSTIAGAWVALLMALMLGVQAWTIFGWPRHWAWHHFVYATQGGIHALEQVFDERPHAEAATALVNGVKEEYGALLSDLVYRIENPALFDPAFPAARAFTAALISWDTGVTTLTGQELGTLAAEVRVKFEAARAEAEAAGMGYLPVEAREPAGRALKAVRLAASTDSAGERKAALTQVIEILSDLAIYYLPNPREAQEMIEGRRLLELPGRRLAEDG